MILLTLLLLAAAVWCGRRFAQHKPGRWAWMALALVNLALMAGLWAVC